MAAEKTFMFRGRLYWLDWRRPYKRVDGRPSEVLVWTVHGCKDCGKPFGVKGGPLNVPVEKYRSFRVARCGACRARWKALRALF